MSSRGLLAWGKNSLVHPLYPCLVLMHLCTALIAYTFHGLWYAAGFLGLVGAGTVGTERGGPFRRALHRLLVGGASWVWKATIARAGVEVDALEQDDAAQDDAARSAEQARHGGSSRRARRSGWSARRSRSSGRGTCCCGGVSFGTRW